jgi:hypothetical protein
MVYQKIYSSKSLLLVAGHLLPVTCCRSLVAGFACLIIRIFALSVVAIGKLQLVTSNPATTF